MENNMKYYEQLQTPPNDALKTIGFGNLKGKSDINPQWRYEALTNVFGVCGIGWKFESVEHFTQALPSGELMVFVKVNLYVREGDKWSEPIVGWGGDYLIKKDKNGIHGNDEAMKMATTDALGTAAKMLGVAADVYRGLIANGTSDSKYARRDYAAHTAQNAPQQAKQAKPSNHTTAPAKTPVNGAQDEVRAKAMQDLTKEMHRIGCTGDETKALAAVHFGKTSTKEMTTNEICQLAINLESWVMEEVQGVDNGK
jgi:hypothetical protein